MDYYYLAKRETETQRHTQRKREREKENELLIHTTCMVLKGTVLTEKASLKILYDST